jgi:hypothetical protein
VNPQISTKNQPIMAVARMTMNAAMNILCLMVWNSIDSVEIGPPFLTFDCATKEFAKYLPELSALFEQGRRPEYNRPTALPGRSG